MEGRAGEEFQMEAVTKFRSVQENHSNRYNIRPDEVFIDMKIEHQVEASASLTIDATGHVEEHGGAPMNKRLTGRLNKTVAHSS